MTTRKTEAMAMGTTNYTVSGSTMVLDEATTAAYEDIGPIGNETRRELIRDAGLIAKQLGSPVEIRSDDGITLGVIPADWLD